MGTIDRDATFAPVFAMEGDVSQIDLSLVTDFQGTVASLLEPREVASADAAELDAQGMSSAMRVKLGEERAPGFRWAHGMTEHYGEAGARTKGEVGAAIRGEEEG